MQIQRDRNVTNLFKLERNVYNLKHVKRRCSAESIVDTEMVL